MNWKIEHTAEGHTDEGIDTVSYVYAEIAVEMTDDYSEEEFKEEVRDYFREECSCAGDCCGHWFGGVDFMTHRWNMAMDAWIVRASYRRNV